jgi:hypothetical protein
VASGLGAFGYDVPAKDIDRALNANKGSNEKQRKAIYDTVVSRLGADQAMDRDKIMEAVDGALTLSGSKVDLLRLMADLKKKGGTQGDLARIFEGRQSVRMLSLLKADLGGILKDVDEGVPGYGKKAFDIKNQGLEKAVREIDASWQTLSNTLVRAVLPELTAVFSSIAGGLKNLAASSPATLKLGIGLTAAAAAAGPLMFALGAVGRVGTFALTALLIPIGLAARGIVGLGVAMAGFATAAIGRIAVMALGFRMLSTFGAGATLAAMGASLGRLALAVLLFPVTALRAIGLAMWALVANPVGLIIGGLVVALAALGLWVSNNWAGIKEFFSAFGSSFMAGIGGTNGPLGTMVGHLQSAYTWLSQLLGPLDETGTKWREWGAAVGGAAASGINAVIDAIQRVIGFFSTAIEKAVSFGRAVGNLLGFGGGGAPAALMATPAPLAGARALGGPVSFGRPYLVGERGPELFVPGMSGRVETNNTLRRLTADGAAAVAGSTSTSSTRTYSLSPTINIVGGGDPREAAAQVRAEMERYLRDLEAEQRGLLSD